MHSNLSLWKRNNDFAICWQVDKNSMWNGERKKSKGCLCRTISSEEQELEERERLDFWSTKTEN